MIPDADYRQPDDNEAAMARRERLLELAIRVNEESTGDMPFVLRDAADADDWVRTGSRPLTSHYPAQPAETPAIPLTLDQQSEAIADMIKHGDAAVAIGGETSAPTPAIAAPEPERSATTAPVPTKPAKATKATAPRKKKAKSIPRAKPPKSNGSSDDAGFAYSPQPESLSPTIARDASENAA